MNRYADGRGLRLLHYINSSGLLEIIEGTSIAHEFKHIYACSFLYNVDGIAYWPAVAVNYTNKTQFIFKINKGVESVYDTQMVNRYMEEDKRPVPFKRMIYVGAGTTDIPCMKLVKNYGGHSIAVYNPEDRKKRSEMTTLIRDNRVNYVCEADYSDGSEMDTVVKAIIDKDCRRHPPRRVAGPRASDPAARIEKQPTKMILRNIIRRALPALLLAAGIIAAGTAAARQPAEGVAAPRRHTTERAAPHRRRRHLAHRAAPRPVAQGRCLPLHLDQRPPGPQGRQRHRVVLPRHLRHARRHAVREGAPLAPHHGRRPDPGIHLPRDTGPRRRRGIHIHGPLRRRDRRPQRPQDSNRQRNHAQRRPHAAPAVAQPPHRALLLGAGHSPAVDMRSIDDSSEAYIGAVGHHRRRERRPPPLRFRRGRGEHAGNILGGHRIPILTTRKNDTP